MKEKVSMNSGLSTVIIMLSLLKGLSYNMIKGWFKLDNHFTLTLHKWKMIKRTFIFKSFVWKDIYLKINYFISKTEYLSLFVMLFTEKEFEWHIKVILLIKYIRETTVGVSIKYFVKKLITQHYFHWIWTIICFKNNYNKEYI